MTFSYFMKGMNTYQIKMGFSEINRNGDATVKLFSKDKNKYTSEILKLISNKTLELSVWS
jgi:hypothetical protein